MNSTNVTIIVVVVLALGAVGLLIFMQQRAQRQRETDPAALIGSGIGNLVAGIVAAASEGDS